MVTISKVKRKANTEMLRLCDFGQNLISPDLSFLICKKKRKEKRKRGRLLLRHPPRWPPVSLATWHSYPCIDLSNTK